MHCKVYLQDYPETTFVECKIELPHKACFLNVDRYAKRDSVDSISSVFGYLSIEPLYIVDTYACLLIVSLLPSTPIAMMDDNLYYLIDMLN